ncbi:MAG: hypothetical protein Q7U52_03115 [Hydrogenophaga sp.]|uniref:hypothetical protein n=1 Tax=Hydrogenophaga sp. TaxID=1904254 RepID=UPI002725C427|nr:hypothetical protein [Hydrogenophaga sp.]MDO9146650.1 hypothetical protein [Hydrogenophaga sp.]MDO9603990.1 hypothetical protein [Hydrogenophaga sp.]
MTHFLWVMIFLWTFSTIGKIIGLIKAHLPPRKPREEPIDVVPGAAMAAWTITRL